MGRRKKIIFLILLIVIFILSGLYSDLQTTYYYYRNPTVPVQFDGYRIAFISDFHCKKFGKKEDKLVKSIIKTKPNLVVFTGDMIDDSHKDITPVEDLLSALSGIYPMYAVSGNHEYDDPVLFKKLMNCYEKYGVIFLDNKSEVISIDHDKIGLYGKPYVGYYFSEKYVKKPDKSLAKFNILLLHDATIFPFMSTLGYNLILSGHTHGGIIRLPFIGGLINNRGGIMAEYDSGLYEQNNCTLISSRGLGNARFPRFFNQPELICITLESS